MLLTPHIVRTHELTAQDLAPIYIGTQQNVGLGGPPPLIAPPPDDPPRAAATGVAGTGTQPTLPGIPGAPPGGVPGPPAAAAPGAQTTSQPRCRRERRRADADGRRDRASAVPPAAPVTAAGNSAAGDGNAAGSSRHAACHGHAARGARRRAIRRSRPRRRPPRPAPHSRTTAAQMIVTPPSANSAWRAGRTLVPLSINNASRLSTLTLTVTYNPAVLRVRNVQEGTFMRQGGVTATFTPRIDAAAGRVDIAIARTGDQRRRVRRGPARRAAVRRGRRRELGDSGQRRREQPRRGAAHASVQSGDRYGEVGSGCSRLGDSGARARGRESKDRKSL